MKKFHTTKNCFTLVELILYIGISSIILLSVSTLISFLLESQAKNRAVMSVEQQGAYITQLITQNIRNGYAILNPIKNNQTESIEIVKTHDAPDYDDLVIFFIDSDNMIMRNILLVGSEVKDDIPTTINNSDIIVTNLSARNLSVDGIPYSISFEFKVSYKQDNNRHEYIYSKYFYGGASLRKKNELQIY